MKNAKLLYFLSYQANLALKKQVFLLNFPFILEIISCIVEHTKGAYGS
jgi:hypothetical protein